MGLDTLPSELLEQVAIRLPRVADYRNLSLACKRHQLVLRNPHVLKQKLLNGHDGVPGPALMEVLRWLIQMDAEIDVGTTATMNATPMKRTLISSRSFSRDHLMPTISRGNSVASLRATSELQLDSFLTRDVEDRPVFRDPKYARGRWSEVFQAFLDTPNLFAMHQFSAKAVQEIFELSALYPAKQAELTTRKRAILDRIIRLNRNININILLQAIFRNAITLGELPIVEHLLTNHREQLGASIDQRWVIRALCDKRCDMADLLLRHQFMVSREHYTTAVQILASHGQSSTLDLFLERVQESGVADEGNMSQGRDLHIRDWAACLRTAWTVCTYEGKVDMARLLLTKYNVQPRAEENAGLKWSCRRGYGELLQVLSEAGLQLTDEEKHFYLNLSISNQHVEVACNLLHYHCGPETVHLQQEQALREAARLGALEIVKMLVEVGEADISACHYDAVRLAKDHNHMEVHAYLMDKAREQSNQSNLPKSHYRRFIDETGSSLTLRGTSGRSWL
jgi:hypothetical protein